MAGKKEIEVAVAEVVDYMRITGQFAPALRDVVIRKITAQAAKDSGIRVSTEELQEASDAFRILNGLNKAEDTENWIKSSGISVDVLEDFLETNLLVSKFKDALLNKMDKENILSSEKIQNVMRDLIFGEWAEKELQSTIL